MVELHSKKHAQLVYECVQVLREVMDCFYRNEFEEMENKVEEISELEHKADIIRRQMEIEFYQGAFLPFDREDRIIMAELVDGVADMTQETAYGISLSQVIFPKKLEEDFSQLLKEVYKAVSALKECIELMDTDLGAAIPQAHEIEEIEDSADVVERKIIKKLYIMYRKEEIDILTLIELKKAAKRLGNIIDRAEDASDRVPIIAAKRRG